MTWNELETLIYDEVKADVECEADAESPYQEGYAVGFNECRWRVLRQLAERLGIKEADAADGERADEAKK